MVTTQFQRTYKETLFDGVKEIAKDKAQDVRINYQRLFELARKYAELSPEERSKQLSMPKWAEPVFPSRADNATIDFMLLGNTINFAFNNFKTGKKYSYTYMNIPWAGAFGMWAALKDAIERGVPILDGAYLANITENEVAAIFNKDSEIPMIAERTNILREVGKVLNEKYGGHFYNVIAASNGRMFDNGSGLVERLIIDFPSFRDSSMYDGKEVVFSKRAQLAAAMVYEKFLGFGHELFPPEDQRQLTVFADYELPKALNILGVIEYSESLKEKIQNGVLLNAGGRAEVELRAATIYASTILEDAINTLLRGSATVSALNIDYALFQEGRKHKEVRAHMCFTTNY